MNPIASYFIVCCIEKVFLTQGKYNMSKKQTLRSKRFRLRITGLGEMNFYGEIAVLLFSFLFFIFFNLANDCMIGPIRCVLHYVRLIVK